ncbi:hypothetical protein KVR01_011644 [Diaporthe batatas]|uniref:uncharacterized protein n=1 Tax=Diaporthe batatas TaxID=748121 RepID=UPI001D03E47F|nr:uncharacterized protein KVR01_011644 [Diaporthe batatas]KAG8158522.1 hypothetical protein KVR01_011644 [Diaporthe batatas]
MPSFSFSSTAFSSSETRNGSTTTHSYTEERRSDPSGTTVRTTTQNDPDAPPVQEVRYFDAGGHEVPAERAAHRGLGGATPSRDSSRRIEDVSDREKPESEVDRLYRERMEDEYAKREGGA